MLLYSIYPVLFESINIESSINRIENRYKVSHEQENEETLIPNFDYSHYIRVYVN